MQNLLALLFLPPTLLLLAALLILLALILPAGWTSISCTDESPGIVSPDGTIMALVSVRGGCSGATGGYYTEVIVRKRSWAADTFLLGDSVFLVRHKPLIRLEWASSRRLIVRYPPELDGSSSVPRTLAKRPQVGAVAVEYRAVE